MNTKHWLPLLLTLTLFLAPLNPAAASSRSPTQAARPTAPAASIWYVDYFAAGANTGTSWTNAFTQLQSAFSNAYAGDQIWVAQGVYTATNTTDRTATFTLKDNLALYGGFDPANGADTWEERDWKAHITVLSGDLDGDDITDPNGVLTSTANIIGDNTYHVLTSSGLDASAVLDGFYVTGGKADGSASNSSGGGVYNNGGSPTLINIAFSANQASNNGGGMCNEGGGPSLVNVIFTANRAIYNGGGMYNYSSPSLVNVIFIGNQASSGGGMHNESGSPDLFNVTFSANQAATSGGGMVNADSESTISNSILWGNNAPTGAQVYNMYGGDPIFRYDIVQGGCPSEATCDHLIDADPLFMHTPSGGGYSNLRLQATSPAIEAGNNTYLPADAFDLDSDGNTGETLPFDLDSAARIYYSTVDLGAYEFHRLYVDHAATGANNGSSWADAYSRLQSALEKPGAQVWVAQGVYTATNTTDRTATFNLKLGQVLYGGFDPASGADAWAERDWLAHPTVLSGDLDDNDITDANGVVVTTTHIVGNNAYHVLTTRNLDPSTALDGFVITGGKADFGGGGGMDNENSSPSLANIIFSANSGGGMRNIDGSSPSLVNVTFTANRAVSGGGMRNYRDSSPSLINVTFSGNWADNYGGGMYNSEHSSPHLVNVTFSANRATYGGGMENYDNSPSLVNVTFAANQATYGGGMDNYGINLTISNSILWGNNAPNGAQIYNEYSTPTLRYTIVQGGCPSGSTCEHVIDADPLFVRPPSGSDYGDLRLRLTSPAIDAGNNTYLPLDIFDLDGDGDTSERIPFDLAGMARFVDIAGVIDSGVSDPPNYLLIVDMGAYEAFAWRLYLPVVVQ